MSKTLYTGERGYEKSLKTIFVNFRMIISALDLLLFVFYEIFELYKKDELFPN